MRGNLAENPAHDPAGTGFRQAGCPLDGLGLTLLIPTALTETHAAPHAPAEYSGSAWRKPVTLAVLSPVIFRHRS